MQNFLCFQPQYFSRFKCDGAKCNACCCGGWNIFIDKETYAHYPKEFSAQFKFDAKCDTYLVQLNEKNSCPFLTDEKLCSLQLTYGENFLSPICRTYPRVINFFGIFFERSLSLSCSVAAEMILFHDEPTAFELIEIPSDTTKKFLVNPISVDEKFSAHVIDIQVAMISILQERTLSIDQRLIVLGFFLDKLDEISAHGPDEDALIKLLDAYESKKFFAEQVPLMLRSVTFDEEKFSRLMPLLFDELPDKIIPGAAVAANYKLLGKFRKKFRAEHSIFLENFIVNEFFMLCCPWRFSGTFTNNFAFFVALYKFFELMLLSAAVKNSLDRERLMTLARHFEKQMIHVQENQLKIFLKLENAGDVFAFTEALLEGSD